MYIRDSHSAKYESRDEKKNQRTVLTNYSNISQYSNKIGVLFLILSIHGLSLSRVASSPKEAIDITAKSGFKYLELPVTTWKINPETVTKKDIANIKDMLHSGSVEVNSLGMIWPINYRMVTRSTTEWKRNVNYANKLFDFSAVFGVKIMNLGGPLVRSIPQNIPYFNGFKMLVSFWKEACKHAEDLGIVIGIEHIVRDHQSNVGDTTKQVVDMIKAVDSPSFQINAQIHQMAYSDLNIAAAIRASGDMIKLVHIADVMGFNPLIDAISFITPGKGRLDFVSVFKALKNIGYDGEIVMEPDPWGPGDNYMSELRSGRKFLEEKWKQA